jgi:hypothetical protein
MRLVAVAENVVRIHIDTTPLRQTRWLGHLKRFMVGGAVTVATGLVGSTFGPVAGGLFLAFPAIFPVGLSMMAKLEREKVGPSARGDRARRAAIAEAAGAAIGSMGLIAFASIVWWGLRRLPAAVALGASVGGWLVVAPLAWALRRVARASSERHRNTPSNTRMLAR